MCVIVRIMCPLIISDSHWQTAVLYSLLYLYLGIDILCYSQITPEAARYIFVSKCCNIKLQMKPMNEETRTLNELILLDKIIQIHRSSYCIYLTKPECQLQTTKDTITVVSAGQDLLPRFAVLHGLLHSHRIPSSNFCEQKRQLGGRTDDRGRHRCRRSIHRRKDMAPQPAPDYR